MNLLTWPSIGVRFCILVCWLSQCFLAPSSYLTGISPNKILSWHLLLRGSLPAKSFSFTCQWPNIYSMLQNLFLYPTFLTSICPISPVFKYFELIYISWFKPLSFMVICYTTKISNNVFLSFYYFIVISYIHFISLHFENVFYTLYFSFLLFFSFIFFCLFFLPPIFPSPFLSSFLLLYYERF